MSWLTGKARSFLEKGKPNTKHPQFFADSYYNDSSDDEEISPTSTERSVSGSTSTCTSPTLTLSRRSLDSSASQGTSSLRSSLRRSSSKSRRLASLRAKVANARHVTICEDKNTFALEMGDTIFEFEDVSEI
mmetsp:Transcript_42150/g.76408  ORF Transcript_42150/g.76408 Transcript_42150/m.76408 type:complete len:132 (-) Transcript_42150:16-411(-)